MTSVICTLKYVIHN